MTTRAPVVLIIAIPPPAHLVLAPPPYVPAQVKLLLGELALAQQVVELVHRQVHNVLLGHSLHAW